MVPLPQLLVGQVQQLLGGPVDVRALDHSVIMPC